MVWFEEQDGGEEMADHWVNLLMSALEKVSQKTESNGYAPENSSGKNAFDRGKVN